MNACMHQDAPLSLLGIVGICVFVLGLLTSSGVLYMYWQGWVLSCALVFPQLKVIESGVSGFLLTIVSIAS